jgi:hypothetical protein
MWRPSLKLDKTFSQNLASAALSYTTDYGRRGRLEQITIKATVAITEIITVTLDSAKGSAYDVVLDSRELSGEQSYVFRPQGDLHLQEGDEIKIQCTNANGTGTVSGVIKSSELPK